MALMTRPSQRSDGRMASAALLTTARQPRRTPSSAANGMAKACFPAKPTTSQGIGGPAAVSMVSLEPTTWRGWDLRSPPSARARRPRGRRSRPRRYRRSVRRELSSHSLVIPGRERSERTRNPEPQIVPPLDSGSGPSGRPGMTERASKRRKPALRLTGRCQPLTRCLPGSLIIGSSSKGLRLTNRPGQDGRAESLESVRPDS